MCGHFKDPEIVMMIYSPAISKHLPCNLVFDRRWIESCLWLTVHWLWSIVCVLFFFYRGGYSCGFIVFHRVACVLFVIDCSFCGLLCFVLAFHHTTSVVFSVCVFLSRLDWAGVVPISFIFMPLHDRQSSKSRNCHDEMCISLRFNVTSLFGGDLSTQL